MDWDDLRGGEVDKVQVWSGEVGREERGRITNEDSNEENNNRHGRVEEKRTWVTQY